MIVESADAKQRSRMHCSAQGTGRADKPMRFGKKYIEKKELPHVKWCHQTDCMLAILRHLPPRNLVRIKVRWVVLVKHFTLTHDEEKFKGKRGVSQRFEV